MTTLDAPDRETCLIRRARTNTPLQALVLLNDPTYVEAARKLAERVIEIGQESNEARLQALFRLALARIPSPAEQALMLGLLDESQKKFKADPLAADKLLQVGHAPSRKEIGTLKIEPSELAAWATLASLVLNLDETMTRN